MQGSENKLDCDFDYLSAVNLQTSENCGTMYIERVLQKSCSATACSKQVCLKQVAQRCLLNNCKGGGSCKTYKDYTHKKKIFFPYIQSVFPSLQLGCIASTPITGYCLEESGSVFSTFSYHGVEDRSNLFPFLFFVRLNKIISLSLFLYFICS